MKHSKLGLALLVLAVIVAANIGYQLVQHDTPTVLIVPAVLSILANGLWLSERCDKAAQHARTTKAGTR